MSEVAVVDTSALGRKRGVRSHPKGRPVDPQALIEIRALLGRSPRQRDVLIEFLHRIQDRYGHISAAHILALAEELKLARTEVYEVATFYHHFDVVKEGETPPPGLTVRVCDSITCSMFGSDVLINKLSKTLGPEVRVLHAPCVGRCESAPVAVVGQNPVLHATAEKVADAVSQTAFSCAETKYTDFKTYKKEGGYRLIADCLAG